MYAAWLGVPMPDLVCLLQLVYGVGHPWMGTAHIGDDLDYFHVSSLIKYSCKVIDDLIWKEY